MATEMGFLTLPFIVSTDRRKEDPETRRLIRSHVMRGKNRVKPRKKSQNFLHGNSLEAESLEAGHPSRLPSIPRMLCTEYSTIPFADAVEPARIADIMLFSTMSSKAMFLLDQCIRSTTAGMAQTWFEPMLFDAAYLNAICLTIQTYFDGFCARTRSLEAQRRDCVYYAKTVRILQDRLAFDDDSLRLSDSTIMTILALSGHAYTTGDYESANNHNRGLLKLVCMRGAGTFFQDTKLLIEIIRCDLSIAIDNGSKPMLFAQDTIPWPLIRTHNVMEVSDELFLEHSRENVCNPLDLIDQGLANVWAAMSDFCALVNAASEEGTSKIAEETFLHIMGSIMYRLLHQDYETGSLDEAFRLGLLAFSAPLFLNWNRVELPDHHFTSAYREALARLSPEETVVGPQVHIWLLMVGALTMSHEPENLAWIRPWFRMNIELCGTFTWTGIRELLSSFLWIGTIYDNAGEHFFNLILALDS